MQKVYLNMVPGSVPPVINAAQFDSDRPFQLEIMDGSAAADLTGLSVKIDGLKPDNLGFQYDETSMVGAHNVVSVTGNVVTIRTPVQMTAVDGRTVCTLEITDGDDETVSSLMFYLQVQKSPLVGVVISETELPAIIALAQRQEEDAEAWANGTRGGVPVSSDDPAYHNNSRYYMEQAEEAAGGVLEKYPKIVNNYWYIWDVDEDDYVNTGVRADGTPGVGVPAGGTTGQVLAKASGTDYDTEWVNGGAGGDYMKIDGSNSADLVTLKNKLVVSTYPAGFYILGSATKVQGAGELITFTFNSALSDENYRRFEALIDAVGVTGYRHNNVYKGITIKSVATSVVTAVFEDAIEDAISVPAGTHLLFQFVAYAKNRAFVSGSGSVSSGGDASAVGYLTVASGVPSHAEGSHTLAAGGSSHAEGLQTKAKGQCAHAEGNRTIADGANAHAEGGGTTASGSASHAEGSDTRALADYSHVEGGSGIAYANANYAHIEGYLNYAYAHQTHVEGRNNSAAYENQHVSGKYNNNKSDTLLEVGNGTSSARSNAFEVTVDGYIRTKGRADKIAFGVDSNGNYGYIPAGADTVIPFKSGGGYTINVATTSPEFYGQTITISLAGTVVGTTTFDNTGSAEYTVDEAGLYTVSVTLSGTTFSNTVEVTDTFDTTIEATPDGSTVTPVNDIQIWLHCANIWDKNYTTLDAVLADSTTLLALINSNNAVDYMVRSHDWCTDVCADATAMTYIGANDYASDKLLDDSTWCSAICNGEYCENVLTVKIPTMTSNTAPSGEIKVIGNSGAGTDYTASRTLKNGFDGDDSTYDYIYFENENGNSYSYEYHFASALVAKKLKLRFRNNNAAATFTFQISEDNSSWTTLETFEVAANAWLDQSVPLPSNNTKCSHYRVLAPETPYNTGSSGGYATYYCIFPYTMQIWGRP